MHRETAERNVAGGKRKSRIPRGIRLLWHHPAEAGSEVVALAAELHDVLGGRALLALDDGELDALAFLEALEALPLDGRVVDRSPSRR